jgi:Ca-activated chloride channel family protein
VAVEEKSVVDYNQGNPDGVLDPGEEVRPPRVPLVAVYPKEGTIFSDNPLFILDAPWVTPALADAAEAFQAFVLEPDNQQVALQHNFRPANPAVPIGAPLDAASGVDADEPQTLLQVPTPPVMVELLDNWAVQRKEARVLLVVDVSGSMKEAADPPDRATKLQLAQEAATGALDDFKPTDDVGLRVFSTGLGPDGDSFWLDPVPLAPMAGNGDALRQQLAGLYPTNGTPLYDVARGSFDALYETYDPTRINAVVLLTDGRNDDGAMEDDLAQLADAVTALQRGSMGEHGRPVRLFTIGYGADADLAVLRQLAQATNGASYNASDPRSIEKVFTAVVSNF